MNRRPSGFTLVEIVAVLLLLAVLASVVVVRAGRTGNRVPGAADVLVQHITYARARAMSTTNVWELFYGNTGLRLTRDGTEVPLPDADTAVLPAGVSITSGGSVVFDGFGAPDAQKVIPLTDGVSTRTVTIWAETGMVE